MQFSNEQGKAITLALDWLANGKKQLFRIFGYAGTGKSTIAAEIARQVRGRVLYAAYTGKAALVMRSKGCEGASTLHSLIYRAVTDDRGRVTFTLNHDSELRDAELLIVDECSMVGPDLGEDLLSFKTKVLVLGDPGQLPPVKGAGFFDSATPDVMLTEIHRQARDNPIIQLSMLAREGKPLPRGKHGESRVITRYRWEAMSPEEFVTADQMIVGTNVTRRAFISDARQLLGHSSGKRGESIYPKAGEKLICLRNDRKLGLLNGGQWITCEESKPVTVRRSSGSSGQNVELAIRSLDTGTETRLNALGEYFWGGEALLQPFESRGLGQFDYAYAITCHKAQGSQFGHVLLLDESSKFRDASARWLYTAITRASEKVTVVQ